jgi:prevent-host-death family protein
VTVGTKELKNRLSHYLQRVRHGDVVQVTDRGKVIAEIRSVGAAATSEDEALADLEKSGIVTRGSGRLAPIKPIRLRRGVSAARAVLADRD